MICHHPDCGTVVPQKMWACRMHWPTLPTVLRNWIWDTYDADETKKMGDDYREAAAACATHWEATV